ncbi:MAG TPA: transglutaminase family protein [Candidatus Limnocylindria bacterium]|nr:transglutaminase family protein [Candidatus Limnocylindria bacterium]
MSSLRITHETLYQYHRLTRFGPHRLVLRPREGHDLQVERMTLTIEPAYSLDWSRDVFGNSVASVDFLAEAAELRIVSQVDIRRGEIPRLAERSSHVVPYPLVYDELETTVAAAYLVSVYPEEMADIAAWARTAIASADAANAVSIVATLNQAVKQQIGYNRREEKGVQRPLETLNRGTGSCRDMATLLMEGCRALGIAARFSSGYLDCAASLAGRASTHAWAEAYLAGRGWTGFDPTLGEQTNRKHIAIGLSNHPRGVMPISGRFYGTSADYIGMKVAVKFEMRQASSIEGATG